MPMSLVRPLAATAGPSVDTVTELARSFRSSREATALRLVQTALWPCAVAMWHVASKPSQEIAKESQPTLSGAEWDSTQRKLRVRYAFHNADFGYFLHKNLSAEPDGNLMHCVVDPLQAIPCAGSGIASPFQYPVPSEEKHRSSAGSADRRLEESTAAVADRLDLLPGDRCQREFQALDPGRCFRLGEAAARRPGRGQVLGDDRVRERRERAAEAGGARGLSLSGPFTVQIEQVPRVGMLAVAPTQLSGDRSTQRSQVEDNAFRTCKQTDGSFISRGLVISQLLFFPSAP